MILQSKMKCLKHFDKTHCSNQIFEVFYQNNPQLLMKLKTEAPLSNENTCTPRLLPSVQPKRPHYAGQKNHG